MNNLEELMYVTWLLMALTGIFAYRGVLAINDFVTLQRRRRQYASLVPATKENICQGPHKWDTIKLALNGLPVDRYMVCLECGSVATQEASVKLNPPGLEMYRNEVRLRKENDVSFTEMVRRRQEELDRIMNIMVQHHYTDRLDIELLQQFFRKTVIEVDSLYTRLNKELDEEEKRG